MASGDVDIYLLPIPGENVEAYARQAVLMEEEQPADMSLMRYGGFKTFVTA